MDYNIQCPIIQYSIRLHTPSYTTILLHTLEHMHIHIYACIRHKHICILTMYLIIAGKLLILPLFAGLSAARPERAQNTPTPIYYTDVHIYTFILYILFIEYGSSSSSSSNSSSCSNTNSNGSGVCMYVCMYMYVWQS